MILRTQISPFAKNISIEEIQQPAFPYNKTALGEFVADTEVFDVDRIKIIKHDVSLYGARM